MTSALPFCLVKVGGELVEDPATAAALAHNLAQLGRSHRTVVVHGGGPQVSALQGRLGQTVTKVMGQRVTSRDDVYAVSAAIAGVVNVSLCAALLAEGVNAFGCHGASGAMVKATKRPPAEIPGHGVVDYGEVGDVHSVDTGGLLALLDAGYVPVIATLGIEADTGRVLNVNGDSAAAAVAAALPASLVLLVTAVGGVFRDRTDPSTRLPLLRAAVAQALIDDGTISDGMVPKVKEALALLSRGTQTVAIVDASAGAFAAAAKGDDRGTRFVA